ncbi:MAG: LPP20 family lipoprotein [Candidatus Latescibacteria bacterium]|nr:LPP20 family lipoprotein [Candidatus Latescibacterota bacterium]
MRDLMNIALLAIVLATVGCATSGGGPREIGVRSPAWLSTLPQRQGWLFAVGEAGPHFFDQRGWETAEKNARENLGLAIQTRVKSEYISLEGMLVGQTGVETSQEVLDVALFGAQVLKRYKDPTTGHYHILVGISARTAAENILKAGQRSLEERGDKQTAEAIQQRKEELMRKLEKELEEE